MICRVIVGVFLSYRDYMPPNFESDFLHGRQHYFFGSYQWAFYTHITSGPCSLMLGMILVSKQFRLRFAKWHRYLGRMQVACVLLLVTPSGLWMASYAETGAIAGTGFVALAVVTGMCVAFGLRSAVKRRFAEHQRWMLRCYLLLCSAVVLTLCAIRRWSRSSQVRQQQTNQDRDDAQTDEQLEKRESSLFQQLRRDAQSSRTRIGCHWDCWSLDGLRIHCTMLHADTSDAFFV